MKKLVTNVLIQMAIDYKSRLTDHKGGNIPTSGNDRSSSGNIPVSNISGSVKSKISKEDWVNQGNSGDFPVPHSVSAKSNYKSRKTNNLKQGQ